MCKHPQVPCTKFRCPQSALPARIIAPKHATRLGLGTGPPGSDRGPQNAYTRCCKLSYSRAQKQQISSRLCLPPATILQAALPAFAESERHSAPLVIARLDPNHPQNIMWCRQALISGNRGPKIQSLQFTMQALACQLQHSGAEAASSQDHGHHTLTGTQHAAKKCKQQAPETVTMFLQLFSQGTSYAKYHAMSCGMPHQWLDCIISCDSSCNLPHSRHSQANRTLLQAFFGHCIALHCTSACKCDPM